MAHASDLPDWERLLAAERHLQYLLPGAVLVGGTAAALHARHRVSLDGDHVVADLRDRFDDVLSRLESVAGWESGTWLASKSVSRRPRPSWSLRPTHRTPSSFNCGRARKSSSTLR